MSNPDAKPPKDVVLVYSRTDDGQGACVLRSRGGKVETGEVRALKQGAPLQGVEVVKLQPRTESPLLFDVDVQYDGRGSSAHAGPARVTSAAYRSNFDAIFGTADEEAEGDKPN